MTNKTFDFLGLIKIKLPFHANELTQSIIETYLPSILATHRLNEAKIDYCYKAYLGDHDIKSKTRLYADQSDNNNIIVENHLYAQVEFKKGYLLGNPKEYAQKETLKTDDVKYLNKYTNEQNLASVDSDVAEFVFAAGVGYYFIQPKKTDFDIESEAPFVVYCADPRTSFKVYSSYIGEEELFDVIITNFAEPSNNPLLAIQKQFISVYTRDAYTKFEAGGVGFAAIKPLETPTLIAFHELPLVEKYFHSQRISLVELGLTVQNAIDLLSSGSIDAFIDNANEIMAFINTAIEGSTLEEQFINFAKMKKNGIFLLKTNNPAAPADVKSISNKVDFTDINVKYESLIKIMYDTVGVPLSSGNVTSGGDTGQARLLGNGWESAYTSILKDIRSLIKADKKLLKLMLKICKVTVDCKVNELAECEIDIKYNINRSDNLLVKTQSLQNLLEKSVDMPFETAMQIVGVVSDPHSVAIEREKLVVQHKAEEQALLKAQNAVTKTEIDTKQ